MNDKNLRPVTNSDEAKTRGKAGGIKSGEAKRRAKTLKDAMKALLSVETDDGGEKINGYQRIALALYEKAIRGDTFAINSLRDLVGENPAQKVNAEVDNTLTIELAIPRPKAREKQEEQN